MDMAYSVMILPPRKQRYQFLRYEGLEYSDSDIADFESRMAMEHRDEASVVVFTSQGWRRFGEVLLDLDAPEWEDDQWEGDLHDYWRDISTDGDFLGPPPSYTLIRDSVLRLCHRMMAHSIAGRSQAPEKVTVNDLFYLRGLAVGSLDDTWAWVAMGPERQPDAAAGAPAVAEDAPAIDEGDQAVLAPVQAPQQPPTPPLAPARTMPQRMARLEEDVHEIRRALTEQHEVIDAMARDFS
ncbi:hypothetical protein Tco_1339791 [Tanacetum coccineum]